MPGGSRPGPVNRHGFEIAGSAGARLAPDNGPGAGRMAVGRMAARAAEAKNGGRRDSRCPKGAGEEGGGHAAAPAGGKGHRGTSRPVPAPASAAGLRPRAGIRRKFFRNCPCIGGGVPV